MKSHLVFATFSDDGVSGTPKSSKLNTRGCARITSTSFSHSVPCTLREGQKWDSLHEQSCCVQPSPAWPP